MNSEANAYRLLEALLWEGNPICPHCGTIGGHYFLKPKNGVSRKTGLLKSESERRLWKCHYCRNQFSVISGTFLRNTKIPLSVWIQVITRYFLDRDNINAYRVHLEYGINYGTCLRMFNKLRSIDIDIPETPTPILYTPRGNHVEPI